MKTFVKLLFIWLFLLGIAYVTKAQQTKRTTEGYTMLIDGLYLRVDTIGHRTYIYNWTKKRVWITINEGKESLLEKNQVRTVWSNSFKITVSRKKDLKSYTI